MQVYVVHNPQKGQTWVFDNHAAALRCRQEQKLTHYKLWGCVVFDDWQGGEPKRRIVADNPKMTLSKMDRLHLGWLAKQPVPMWGGHLKRGEPISDPDMGRWLETELIEVVGTEGYRITDAGRRAVGETVK